MKVDEYVPICGNYPPTRLFGVTVQTTVNYVQQYDQLEIRALLRYNKFT
jgi:hypothetical protein